MKKCKGGNAYFKWLGQVENNAGIMLTGDKLRKQRKNMRDSARESYFDGYHGL